MSLRPVILQNLMRAATARKVKASTGSDLLHRVRTKGTALSSAERAADELAQGFVAMEETAAAANYFFGQGDFEESGAALDDVIAWAKALKSDLAGYSKLDVDMGEDIEAASARRTVRAKARVTGKGDAESLLRLAEKAIDDATGNMEGGDYGAAADQLRYGADRLDELNDMDGKSGAALRVKKKDVDYDAIEEDLGTAESVAEQAETLMDSLNWQSQESKFQSKFNSIATTAAALKDKADALVEALQTTLDAGPDPDVPGLNSLDDY